MEIFTEFNFCAARKLKTEDKKHICNRLHGHNFKVKIRIKSSTLTSDEWIYDFNHIEKICEKIIKSLDHRYLNDIKGLKNPTCENIAIWLWQKIAAKIPQLYEVSVWENEKRGITFYGEKLN